MRFFSIFFVLAILSFASNANYFEELSVDAESQAEFGQRYSAPDLSLGIPQSYILDITQDKHGFLWFASFDGLVRFDGYKSRVFLSQTNTPDSLPANFVRRAFIDKNEQLWAATFEGLAKFDDTTESFKRIPLNNPTGNQVDIWTLNESVDGDLLVASSDNLYYLDKSTNSLVEYNKNIRFPKNIITLYDEPSRLWIGSFGEGAFIYDKRSKELFRLGQMNPWSLDVDVNALHDVLVLDGKYWLATDKGVLRIDEQNANMVTESYFDDSEVRSIQKAQNGLVVATTSEIIELHKTANTSNYFVSARHKLAQDNVLTFFEDSNNNHWIGTEDGILFQTEYQRNLPLIGSNHTQKNTNANRTIDDIWALDEDSNGKVWSASQGGNLGLFEPESGVYQFFQSEEKLDFWDMLIDLNDRIWIATDSGLKQYTYSEGNIVLTASFFNDTPIYNLHYADDKVWLWLSDSRLVSVDATKNDEVQGYELETEIMRPRVVYFDELQRIWITSSDGAFMYDTLTRTMVASSRDFQSLNSSILTVHDYKNFYWLSTYDQGILQFDKTEFKIIRNQEADVKKGTVMAAVGIDNHIWYADGKYVSQFNLDKFEVVDVITPTQLSYNSFYEGVSIKTDSGLVGFGGKYGYHLFSPEKLSYQSDVDKVTRAPRIMEFHLNAEPMPFTDIRSPLSKPIHLTDNLKLSYNDKRFHFSFALINSFSPNEVEYRYMLEGSDSDWIPIESELKRRAHFHNPPWGSYILKVQAREPGREWSESTNLNLFIAPPPWFSTPALFFYAVFICFTFVYAVRQYQQRQHTQATIKASEERLKLTLWSSGDELWDWDIYRGQVYRSNTWGTIDFPQDDLRTNSAYDGNIHPNDMKRVQASLQNHLDGKTEFHEISYRTKTFKGKWIWVLDRGKVVSRDHNNQPLRMTGTLKNIQHLKEAEEQMRLFERSIENISEGVFITDTVFRFISVNQAYCNFTGESREQALASFMYFHQYTPAFTEEIRKNLKHKGNWSGELESRRVNGEHYEMELNVDAVHDDDGKVSHYVGVFSDITARKSTEKELLKLANTDPLTDLPNRSFFQASQQNLVRRNEAHTLICMDMDNFKKINDSLGHQTGDVLIKQIAKRLQRITGKMATCFRLGGDEFGILMEDNVDVHMITHYAQNILDNLSRPFIINKQEFVLSASIGIAFYPNDGDTPQELLKNADTAMYFAKNAGGNAYKFFSGEMNQNAVRQLQIENLIRQGLKDDLFTVYYQPKVDLASGKLVSMEALVRFVHPQKGVVSPGQFIPLAEQTGQIIEIGEVVLEKALRDTKQWVEMGLFNGRVAVNISAKQFELPDLSDRISSILKKVGISALHLECEITEGTLMENPEQGLMIMQRLREKGVHLALDDFGTGYSSLAYLKRFPLNTLKIDKAFIDDIATSSVDRHMAAAIINIAHNLGLNVVAEGVEHEEQLSILRRYDCEMLQGYLYSKPLSHDRFEKLLRENLDLHSFLTKPVTPQ